MDRKWFCIFTRYEALPNMVCTYGKRATAARVSSTRPGSLSPFSKDGMSGTQDPEEPKASPIGWHRHRDPKEVMSIVSCRCEFWGSNSKDARVPRATECEKMVTSIYFNEKSGISWDLMGSHGISVNSWDRQNWGYSQSRASSGVRAQELGTPCLRAGAIDGGEVTLYVEYK